MMPIADRSGVMLPFIANTDKLWVGGSDKDLLFRGKSIEKSITSVRPVVEPRKPLLDLLYVFRKTRLFLRKTRNLSILKHLCMVFPIVFPIVWSKSLPDLSIWIILSRTLFLCVLPVVVKGRSRHRGPVNTESVSAGCFFAAISILIHSWKGEISKIWSYNTLKLLGAKLKE